MNPAVKSLLFYQLSPYLISVKSVDSAPAYSFRKTGHNQWLLSAVKPLAVITISRVRSSVFWLETAVYTQLRRSTVIQDRLAYPLDPRRKLRWTRQTQYLDIVHGSLTWPRTACIEYMQFKPNFTACLSLYRSDYEAEVIASAFIAMVLWSNETLVSRLRDNWAAKSSVFFNKILWERIVACVN